MILKLAKNICKLEIIDNITQNINGLQYLVAHFIYFNSS